ncbi:MAG: hypothetical protein ACHQ1H_06210 [Nitrososphaerales archaeon]
MNHKLRNNREISSAAISGMVGAVVIIVIIVIAAGSLIVFTQSPKTSTSSVASSNTSVTSYSSLSSISSSTSSASGTQSSTVSSASASSLSASTTYSGRILVSFADPNSPIIGPNLNLSYPLMVTSLGNVPSSVAFSPVFSKGIYIHFSPNNITLGSQVSLTAMLSVGHNVTPGTYDVQALAVGGGGSFNASLSIQVVQYVVAIEPSFTPANLTVTPGSAVTWVRLNGVLGEHADNGSQNVVFNNGMAQSPQLAQYDSYSYTFTQAGNFPYHSTYRDNNGEITVVTG